MSFFFLVPIILFLTIVVPTWIVMHYVSLSRARKGLDEESHQALEDMLETLDALSERIETLESILNEEHPRWRKDNARVRGE